MQHVTFLILGLLAGIAGYAGVTHLLIGSARRPRDTTQLLFGLLSLAITIHTLMVLALHTATSTADYVAILKYGFGPTSLAVIVILLWFVAFYSGARPRRFLLVMSVWFGLISVLNLRLRFGILYDDISNLHHVSLPWGEQIVVAQGTPHPWRPIIDLFFLTMFGFFCYALAQQYRWRNQRQAITLSLALVPFLVARVIDPLVVLGIVDSIYTSEFALLGIVIAMSLVLSHKVAQTETELQTYQQHLTELVAIRTAALTDANYRLTALKQVADIGIRMNELIPTLQAISEVATALFTARSTMLLIPSQQKMKLPIWVGFEHSSGALDPVVIDIEIADLPRTNQVLTHGQSLLIPALQARPLPPAFQAFVTARQMQSTMLIPLAVSGTVIGVLAVATDQAGRTFTNDEVSLAEMIASSIAAVIENDRLSQHAVTARERLTLLYQVAQTISSASLDTEQIYATLHTITARLMPTEVFVIILFDTVQQEAEDVYLADKDGRWPGKRYALANTFAGYMLWRNASLRIDDFSVFPQSEFAFELFRSAPSTESGVAVLMRSSEEVIGLLVVQSYTKGAYSVEDQEALELLAAQAAVTLDHAQRYRQGRALAASEERTRLAHELHDAVTQTLYSASLLAEALPIIWRRNAGEGERDAAILRQLVRGALAEMRTLLFELRPSALLTTDMDTLLRQLGDTLTGKSRVPVTLMIESQMHLPIDLKIAVYRIAQEAFNNIAKHAGATQVGVTFRAAEGRLFLAVRDDGRGFDPSGVAGERMGVRIMAERAAGIGAYLRIDSMPEQGTTVSISWPEPAAGQDDKMTR